MGNRFPFILSTILLVVFSHVVNHLDQTHPSHASKATTGIILGLGVLLSTGFAVYEASPHIQRLVDRSRRRLALALHELGDGIDPRRNRWDSGHGEAMEEPMAMAWSSGTDGQGPAASTRSRDREAGRDERRNGDDDGAGDGGGHDHAINEISESQVPIEETMAPNTDTHRGMDTDTGSNLSSSPGPNSDVRRRRGSFGSSNRQVTNVRDVSQVEEAGEMAELRRQKAREGIMQKRELLLASKQQHEKDSATTVTAAASEASHHETELPPEVDPDAKNSQANDVSSRSTSLSDFDQVVDDLGHLRLAEGIGLEAEAPETSANDTSSSQAQSSSQDFKTQAQMSSPTHQYTDFITFDEPVPLIDSRSTSIWANPEARDSESGNINDYQERRPSTLTDLSVRSFSDDTFEMSDSFNTATQTVNHSPAPTPVLPDDQQPSVEDTIESETILSRPGTRDHERITPSNDEIARSRLSTSPLEEGDAGTFPQNPFEDARYQTPSTPTNLDSVSIASFATSAKSSSYAGESEGAMSTSQEGSFVEIEGVSDVGSSDGTHAAYTPSVISSSWSDVANDVGHEDGPHLLDQP